MTHATLTHQPAHYSATIHLDLFQPQETSPQHRPINPEPTAPVQSAYPEEPTNALIRLPGGWRLSFDGRTYLLADQKGLRYLAILLDNPYHAIAATDLKAQVDGKDPRLLAQPDMEVADQQAITASMLRLQELTEDIDEAVERGDWQTQEACEREKDQIVQFLAAAKGLGGRRRQSPHANRTRLSVRKCVDSCLKSITELDPDLGRYLTASIRLGYQLSFCPFDDDAWRVQTTI